MTTSRPPTAAPASGVRSGPLGALRRLAGAVRWSFVLDRFQVFVRPVEAEHAAFEAPAGYRFAWGTPEDVAAFTEFDTELSERERGLGSERLGIGHRVVVGFAPDGENGERAVFTMWVNPRNLNIPGELKRALRESQVFIYKAYTSPDHRGRKLYQAGMRFVLADLAANGGAELVGYAHAGKLISRKGLSAVGFEPVGAFVTVGFRRWRRTFTDARLRERFPVAVSPSGVGLDR